MARELNQSMHAFGTGTPTQISAKVRSSLSSLSPRQSLAEDKAAGRAGLGARQYGLPAFAAFEYRGLRPRHQARDAENQDCVQQPAQVEQAQPGLVVAGTVEKHGPWQTQNYCQKGTNG